MLEGAIIEGAALATQALVWPRLLDDVLKADEVAKKPLYRLTAGLDDARAEAGAAAAVKVFLRDSCDASAPSSVDYAMAEAARWGASSPSISARAHFGMQAVSYGYGSATYLDMMKNLETQVGATVDPFVLQACKMVTAKKEAGSVAKLKTCLKK